MAGPNFAAVQVQLLVWIFVMRVMMVIASGGSYLINEAIAKARYGDADNMNYEAPLTSLVWLTSLVSVALTYLVVIPAHSRPRRRLALVEALDRHHLRNACGRDHSRAGQDLHLHSLAHTKEVVTSSREGGASLNILSGLVAGNFTAFWLGMAIMALMAIAYLVSTQGLGVLMMAPAVFAFGLVAFGFLGWAR